MLLQTTLAYDATARAAVDDAPFMAEYYSYRSDITWADSVPHGRDTERDADLSIDWVKKGAVTPATSQGRCATCQDFSCIADVEGAWHLAGNPLLKLSEQEMIDCGGGDAYGMKWIVSAGGVSSNAHTPLANHSDKNLTGCRDITDCDAAKTHKDAFINGSTCLTNHEEDKILALLQHGPMSVSVNAAPFNGYTGGIINCSGSGVDHAVTLVAFGADAATGEKFWTIKNSWGPDFGESSPVGSTSPGSQGYARLKFGNLCLRGPCQAFVGKPPFAAKRDDTAVVDFSVDGMDVALDNKNCGSGGPGPCTYAVASLTVVGNATNRFDFLPAKGQSFLGEISGLRVAYAGGVFVDVQTKGAPATALPAAAGEYAAATINLRSTKGTPSLGLERRILKAPSGFSISLTLKNQDTKPIEVGAFGVGLPFVTMGNVGGTHSLNLFADMCTFIDPQIGTGGFVSVTRMTGLGSVLLVVPENGTDFQAYRSASGSAFEITSLSKAYALKEWANASKKQWVEPSSARIAPGESVTFAYRVLRAKSIREKDDALAAAGFPVLQAVPSYTIATDMRSAQLHVLPPRGSQIAKVTAEPAGAMTFGAPVKIGSKGFYAVHTTGVTAGRVRVTVAFTDGSASVASYFVLPPFDQHMRKYTTFMTETAWYANTSDPFARGQSCLAWNRQLKMRIGVGPWDNGYEDNRIFNNGLSDEAGAGANVGMAAAVAGVGNASQMDILDQYLTKTVYGVKKGLPFGASLQCVEGQEGQESPSCGPPSVVGPTADGVMASMFWVPTNTSDKMPGYDYNPNWFCGTPTSKVKKCPPGWPGWRWDQSRGASLGRAYNYAHVSSCWLAAYQASRNDLVQLSHNRTWYLQRAAKTVVAMSYQASWYSHQGLMDGTNFWTILQALKDEGMVAEFKQIEGIMRNRTLTGVHNQCRCTYKGAKRANEPKSRITWHPHVLRPFSHPLASSRILSHTLAHSHTLSRTLAHSRARSFVPSRTFSPSYHSFPLPIPPRPPRRSSVYVNGSTISDLGNDRPGCHWYLHENVTQPWANQTGLPGAGSEFAWDTTGQEEGYIWGAYFAKESPKAKALALSSLNQILAYTPLVANFAWHGSAYGMGDFGNNGYIHRTNERVLQHYRSGLNSIPSTEAFLADPTDLYLLRLAAGSISGILSNIDADGAPSMAFHSDPALHDFDPASGDHGLSVYGHSHNTQSFLVEDPDKGALCFFCDFTATGSSAVLVPRDTYRRRVFLGTLGLQISSEAGLIARVELGMGAKGAINSVKVVFAAVGRQPLTTLRLRLATRSGARVFKAVGVGELVRGAYSVKPAAVGGETIVSIAIS